MKHAAINLVKFKALQKRLGAPMCHVVGYLESLWIFAQVQARDGDLTKFSALEIAGWIEFPGDPDDLLNALIQTRWIDKTETGSSFMIGMTTNRTGSKESIPAGCRSRTECRLCGT